jgi:hypothetical protein
MVPMTRKCDACRQPFEIPDGSLIRLCRRPECVSARQVGRAHTDYQRQRERERYDRITQDDRIRHMWPEFEAILEYASRIGPADGSDLAVAVKAVARAEGPKACRARLVELSGVAMKWASQLPRDDDQLEPRWEKDISIPAA